MTEAGFQLDLFGWLKKPAPTAAPAPAPAPRPERRVEPRVSLPDLLPLARRLLAASDQAQLAEKIRIHWNHRMTSAAGRAFYATTTIELNPQLVTIAPDEIERTLRHELAHLLAQARAGRRRIPSHGDEWRQACTDLGIPGERATHNLPLPRKTRQKPYLYRCPGCGLEVARTIPIRRPSACLKCCREKAGGHFDKRFQLIKVKQQA